MSSTTTLPLSFVRLLKVYCSSCLFLSKNLSSELYAGFFGPGESDFWSVPSLFANWSYGSSPRSVTSMLRLVLKPSVTSVVTNYL